LSFPRAENRPDPVNCSTFPKKFSHEIDQKEARGVEKEAGAQNKRPLQTRQGAGR
jgi:hypothetical protein